MTEMRRVTISLPDEIDKKIIELKKQDRFVRCSYSEIIRILIATGINSEFAESRGWTDEISISYYHYIIMWCMWMENGKN